MVVLPNYGGDLQTLDVGVGVTPPSPSRFVNPIPVVVNDSRVNVGVGLPSGEAPPEHDAILLGTVNSHSDSHSLSLGRYPYLLCPRASRYIFSRGLGEDLIKKGPLPKVGQKSVINTHKSVPSKRSIRVDKNSLLGSLE
jgi:hypothetical protein